MPSNGKGGSCRLLLCSVMAVMTGSGTQMTSICADAYVTPPQNHRRRSRSLGTTLHSAAPASSVNGLVAHEHSHSTSLFNVGYDAKHIINFYDQRPWEVGLRLNMLGLPFLGELKGRSAVLSLRCIGT